MVGHGPGAGRSGEGDEGPRPLPRADLPATSQRAELARPIVPLGDVAPRTVARGVVAFDLDGTILDSIGRISQLAGVTLHEAFGTLADEARIHYLATTGMPFEAQLAQLYPDVPAERRTEVARGFHQRKIQEAYAGAQPFAEMPKVLKQLDRNGWTLVITTGAEREMAELILEREGLRFWFEEVLGSAQGTKREHVREYLRRYPGVPLFLVGDSRFDMEAASSVPGVIALGRAATLPGWSLTPDDLRRWGAAWADYTLRDLPAELERLEHIAHSGATLRRPRGSNRKGRDRDSPKPGGDPASV